MVAWGKRLFTLFVGIPVALLILMNNVGMLLLATGLCIASLIEYSENICSKICDTQSKTPTILMISIGICCCISAGTGSKLLYDLCSFLSVLVITSFHLKSVKAIDHTSALRLGLDIFGLVYIINGFGFAILLRYTSKNGFAYQVLGLVSAWVCDSAALGVGFLCGRTHLASHLSPAKTVEGAIGGIISAILVVIIAFKIPTELPTLSFIQMIILGIILGCLCIIGDLIESYFKRLAKVKDSGIFFPGHGGCLDRMDSFLFLSQFLYFYTVYILLDIDE